VHDLVLDAFEPGVRPEAAFLVTCSAGTYVRTIAHDVGQALGVGGSLVGLRRLANGPFTSDEAHDLDTIGRLDAQGIAGPYAVLHEGHLLGLYADEDGRGRPELVWTRPEELPGATGRTAGADEQEPR
jgi:tRNA U55 pseudouridine synthase TruB